MAGDELLETIPLIAVLRGDDGNDLRIVVKGREHPEATNPDEREWLNCDILMNCSLARGSSRALLLLADFQEAIERIKGIESPSAGILLLESVDDDITVVVDVPRPDAVQAQVTVCSHDAVLEFSIACALSGLESFRKDIENIVTRYVV